MLGFGTMISRLKALHGEQTPPPATGPFALVMWENACYLMTDERRAEVFRGLSEQVGMSAAAIGAASDAELLPLAQRGGMRPETRVFRWREIARITEEQFGGELDGILSLPYAEAKRALKQFPNIGDPGAEKILLFSGMGTGLPLESNGLRVLVRVGWARQQGDYGRMYRDVQANLRTALPAKVEARQQAFLLLREHGKTVCKEKAPHCERCPLAKGCEYAGKMAASFLR